LTEPNKIKFQKKQKTKRDNRPWGFFEIISSGVGFQVKRISVKPKSRLSLQWHRHRDETLVIARGIAGITLHDKTNINNFGRGQSIHIPRTTIHRIENISEIEILDIIEIQTGDYLGEDDIERLEDDYGRI